MRTYLFIAVGASLGTVLRFLVKDIHIWNNSANFPTDTFFINLTGSFLLALFLTLSLEVLTIGPNTRLAVSTGVLGAFTTFSAFCKEAVLLIQGGQPMTAMVYVVLSVLGGLALAYLGCMLGQAVYGKPAQAPAEPIAAQILLEGKSK